MQLDLEKKQAAEKGDPIAGLDLRSTVKTPRQQPPGDFDEGVLNQKATKLQSIYRGHSARKSYQAARDGSIDQSDMQGMSQLQLLPGSPDILTVELLLTEQLKELPANQKPNIAEGFGKVDLKKTGYVNRKQFAHVITQYPSIGIHGAELRICMDFFDVKQDGEKIDYNAFIRFYRSIGFELPITIQKLRSIILTNKAMKTFKASDTNGVGFLPRAEMLRCISQLGYSQWSQALLVSILQLFEPKVDGQVHYGSFLEFVRENEDVRAVERTSLQLRRILTNGAPVDAAKIRPWFAKLDKDNRGSFSVKQFYDFCAELSVQASKDAVFAIYSEMDPSGVGVNLQQFTAWCDNKGGDEAPSTFVSLSLSEIQRKADLYIQEFAKLKDLEAITALFNVYDWRNTVEGVIDKTIFIHAARRAGFPLTVNELRLVTSNFTSNADINLVSYRRFLTWCVPNKKAGAMESMEQAVIQSQSKPRLKAGALVRFLEKCLNRGVDLLSIFGRYDKLQEGRIPSADFCAALSDLGLSTLTQQEALEVAERFKAVAGDFILYRHILSELLARMDAASGAADINPVETVVSILLKSGVSSVIALRHLCEKYDRRANGTIHQDDMLAVFEDAEMKIRPVDIQRLTNRFLQDDSDWVNYPVMLRAMEHRLSMHKQERTGTRLDEAVRGKVKTMFENMILRGVDYRSEFDKYDDQHTGTVSQQDFRGVMRSVLESDLSDQELHVLEKHFRAIEDPQRVNIVKLIDRMHPRTPQKTADLSDAEYSIADYADELRRMIRRKCDYAVPGELRRPYRHFSRRKDVSAKVGREDFSKALKNLGFQLTADQERELFDTISLNDKDSISYIDFVVFACDPGHKDLIWKLRRTIGRNKITEEDVVRALSDADSNSSGILTAKQFHRSLDKCGIQLSKTDILRLMLRFDLDETQRVNIAAFVNFLKGKSYSGPNGEWRFQNDDTGGDDEVRDEYGHDYGFAALRQEILDRLGMGYTKGEIFQMFDTEGRSILDNVALRNGCKELNIAPSKLQLRGLMKRLQAGANGLLDRAGFFDALGLKRHEITIGKCAF
ncbi:hypothetical protein EON65_38260 [archaeon]|nr:MAG: hypothetical protein EON65_38260 [archaeon]